MVDANSALAASGSAAEFTAFGISGFLVQVLTAPIAIAIDAVSYVASAVLLWTIRVPEAPPPPREDREPVLSEIRDGLRLVRHDPILRAFAGAQMALAALWGIFGAVWFLYVLEELQLGPAVIGLVAGVGGFSSFIGAVAATRATRRFGVGRVAIVAMLLTAVGNAFIPLAPAGLPLLAIGALVMQQLVADSAATVYDITEVSRPPGAGRRPGARAGVVHVLGRGDGRPAVRDAGGGRPGRGHRAARDGVAGAVRRAARGGRPVVLARAPSLVTLPERRRGRQADRSARDRRRRRSWSSRPAPSSAG